MNRCRKELDWFGCYKGQTSRDDTLFPVIRSARKKKGQADLFSINGDGRVDSVAHPAKGSIPLFKRIMATMLEWEWIQPGSVVVDVFGGRGTTAALWCALHPENRAVTVEIEAHFIEMQQQVKSHAESRYGRPFHWTILQSDSRRVDELLGESMGASRCSPPYGASDMGGRGGEGPGAAGNAPQRARIAAGDPNERAAQAIGVGYGHAEGQIGALCDPVCVSSPPYGQGTIGKQRPSDAAKLKRLTETPGTSLYGRNPEGAWFQAVATGYGKTEGNIDLCPDAAVGSPPYEASLNSDDPDKRGGLFRDPKRRNDKTLTGQYEASRCSPPFEDSLQAAPSNGVRKGSAKGRKWADVQDYASVSSPPFEGSLATQDPNFLTPGEQGKRNPSKSNDASYSAVSSPPFEAHSGGTGIPEYSEGPQADPRTVERHAAASTKLGYGENGAGQIGATQGENYAQACGAVYAAMARAGIRYVALVLKNPTRSLPKSALCRCTEPVLQGTVTVDGNRFEFCLTCKKPHGSRARLRRLDKLTCRLLRSAGYRVVGWRRAWLFHTEAQVEALAGQGTLLDGGESKRKRGRISFFRRLHMAKGGVAAAWEDVIFAELPQGRGASRCSPPYEDQFSSGGGFIAPHDSTRLMAHTYGEEDLTRDGARDGQSPGLR